jgi:hypothetical protein
MPVPDMGDKTHPTYKIQAKPAKTIHKAISPYPQAGYQNYKVHDSYKIIPPTVQCSISSYTSTNKQQHKAARKHIKRHG